MDLTTYGDVYGKLKCAFGDKCKVKNVEMDEEGFHGSYKPPSIIREREERRRL